ncbi:Cullin [Macleaya cordata]|uniref:Cullin n=1 Tax=Macleaya cordata TaxID=56857 RepID=A0A200QUG1_MACCD|nr:Cullin [Macleaya cordata]
MSSQKKRTLQIEEDRHRVKKKRHRVVAVADPTYAEKTWKILENAVHEICNHNARGRTFEELYRNAYNMVLQGYGEEMYSGLVTTVTTHLQQVSKSVQSAQGVTFLEELDKKWREHNEALQLLTDVFMYMDRTIVPRTHKTPVHELGLNLWRDNIIHSNKIQTRLLNTLLELVQREDWRSYKQRISANFYSVESQQLLESHDCGAYLKQAEKRLNEEMERVSDYLDTMSLSKIIDVVVKEMIENHMVILLHYDSALVNMFVDDKYEDLERLYRLFQRVSDGLSRMVDVMTSYIQEKSDQLQANLEKSRDLADYVQRLLEEKDKFEIIIIVSFDNDKLFQDGLDSAFDYWINLNPRFLEYLIAFVDEKHGVKGVCEEDEDIIFHQVAMLFQRLKGSEYDWGSDQFSSK